MEFDFEHGNVLLVDKPLDWTSFDIVKYIRSVCPRKYKVGHAGTLDPKASGLLIVCTGRKTKIISQIQEQTKTYEAEVTLGATRPSFDIETEIDQEFDISHITVPMIHEVIKQFIGKIEQETPMYSA
ncbi:UNVERIFIED_CONTAM: hypothetical protein GTU68_037523, partial [Idotea baltica]|nr:hypothetical protein [Idotea baltica]